MSLISSISISSGVHCYDTVEGAQCGPCPSGYEGDGKNCVQDRNPCDDSPCAAGIKKSFNVIST